MKKKLILLFISCITIVAFFMIPLYGQWFRDKLWYRVTAFHVDINHMSLEDRKQARYQKSYDKCMRIAEELKRQKASNPLVLLPPPEYVKAAHVDFSIPEPAVFYYFTGYRSVLPASPGAENATWVLTFEQNKMRLLQLHGRQYAERYIDTFKKYIPVQ